MSKILGNPIWLSKFKIKKFKNIEELESLKNECEIILHQILLKYPYNTFGSFNKFYEDYKIKKSNYDEDFYQFYVNHEAKLNQDSLSCVGLSLSLIDSFKEKFGLSFTDYCNTVSCEEVVKDLGEYNMHLPNTAKEHVLVAIKFLLENNRIGYMLFDPGYHISKAIIVMQDCKFPHTNYFLASEQPNLKREFSYKLIGEKFVAWSVKETRKAKEGSCDSIKENTNLIYVKQAFGNPVTIAEKRSFIFSFKSFVVRDKKGIVAGFYSYLKNETLTVFYPESNDNYLYAEPVRKNCKFTLDDIGSEKLNKELKVVVNYILELKTYINWPKEFNGTTEITKKFDFALNYLNNMLLSYKVAAKDKNFVDSFLKIDFWIEDAL